MSGDAAQDFICATNDFAARRVCLTIRTDAAYAADRCYSRGPQASLPALPAPDIELPGVARCAKLAAHSYRKARIGSILDALLAGKYPAARATPSNTTAASAMVIGSPALTPNSMLGASGSALSPSIAADITR